MQFVNLCIRVKLGLFCEYLNTIFSKPVTMMFNNLYFKDKQNVFVAITGSWLIAVETKNEIEHEKYNSSQCTDFVKF